MSDRVVVDRRGRGKGVVGVGVVHRSFARSCHLLRARKNIYIYTYC